MNENLTICPTCGASYPQGINFCPNCGGKLQKAPPPLPVGNTSTINFASESHNAPVVSTTRPPDFITLSCPNCGGRLQITPDIERFACQYCGYEHIVRHSGGTVSLEPVIKMMNHINTNINQVGAGVNRLTIGAERQASELAIVRLKQEIDDLIKNIGAIDNGPRSLWMVDAVIGGAAVFGWVAAYAEDGINSSLEETFHTIGIFATILVVIMVIATIASSVNAHKMIRQKEDLIRQKQQELNYHYQMVSQKDQ